ncbi:MAG: HEAT repeat domain-containing protein [Polyangiales bacterium]
MSADLDKKLDQVFSTARALRSATESFSSAGDERARVAALGRAVEVADRLEDEEERGERLMRIGDLLGELGGPAALDVLLRLLDDEDPGVRVSAGEALLDLGHSRYAEVAKAFEKAIDAGTQALALAEVPYLLAEIGEPGGVKLCVKLLRHAEPDVVGAAIEALASLGDASAIKDIEKLLHDKRAVPQEEELDSGEFTVGELAADAVAHLRSLRG